MKYIIKLVADELGGRYVAPVVAQSIQCGKVKPRIFRSDTSAMKALNREYSGRGFIAYHS